MSDYLGPNQTRVLDSTNRSFESITYQKQKPPLSSEVNLTGKIDAERNQNTIQAMMPSGWASVGQVVDNLLPSQCKVGDVLCASDSSSSAFKFIAQDLGQNTEKNVAWVNGWRVVVQGSSSPNNVDSGYLPWTNTTEDCLITLPPPPISGSRLDFVFLEVWRKLLTPDDNIYQYGNVDHANPFTNDLIDPARGFETSLRVQLQYRIRVSEIDDLDLYPEGFGPSVSVQGPLDAPNTTCDHANFTRVPGDLGLWIAGAGDDVAQELLQTVDGYTYAIPMFVIRRRNSQAYDPRNTSNGSIRTLADYLNGIASDRPDNLYNDWIVASDFMDLRHCVSQINIDNLCAKSFKSLQANSLKTSMGYRSKIEATHGVSLLGVDSIAPSSSFANVGNWSNYMTNGNGLRRWYSNAPNSDSVFFIQTVNDKAPAGGTWTYLDVVTIDLDNLTYNGVSIIANIPANAYMTVGTPYADGYDFADINTQTITPRKVTIEILAGSTAVGTTVNMVVPLTIYYQTGDNGLHEVPVKFLESRKIELVGTSMLSVAMKDQDIKVRAGTLANAVGTTDGTFNNMLQARGGSTKHDWDFGHQMVYHAVGTGTNNVFFDTANFSGYSVLGVAKVYVPGIGTISNPTVSFSGTTWTVNLGTTIATGKDVELTLYLGDKYFDGNKQSRGITDCYQMVNLSTDTTGTGSKTIFTLYAGSKNIMALGSYAEDNGAGMAFVDGSRATLLTTNNSYPDTSSITNIEFSLAPGAGKSIQVPTLLHSYIDSTEGYAFFYEYIPYQGILDATNSPFTGSIEVVGPSITTTSGSGTITDATYSVGYMEYTSTARQVAGTGTEWLRLADASSGLPNANYVIYSLNDETNIYQIESISSNDFLTIDTTATRVSVSPEFYVIKAVDRPYFNQTNIIDRFPTYNSAIDYTGSNAQLQNTLLEAGPVLESQITNRVQDVAEAPVNTVQFGKNYADRGRSTVYSPSGEIGRGNLGLNFTRLITSNVYKKTYQSYILNKDESGRLYLMVVGSETDTSSALCKFSPYSNLDVVDIFELPGRPLIANRK